MAGVPLRLERPDPAVALLRLCRPAASNAFDARAMELLAEHVATLHADPKVRVVVFTGEGERVFCAGGDRRYFATLDSRAAAVAMSKRMQELLHRLWAGELPVLAAVNGAAVGGGCELLTACHFRIAAEHGSFRFVHAEHGLVPGWGATARLVGQLGRSRALDLLLSARRIDAAEALELGLVDAVVPAEVLLETVLERARRIAGRSATSVRAMLRLSAALVEEDLQASYAREREAFGDCWEQGRLWERFAGANPPD